jgi:cytochrome c oxidase cbb3-type subunit 3
MFSHFPAKGAIAAALFLAACSPASNNTNTPDKTASADTQPAKAPDPKHAGPFDPRVVPYLNSQQVVLDGMGLFKSHNCSGCHSNGGGGMAPALMDTKWIYGSRLEDIHDTIVQGRPNGMPSWNGKIPDADIWKISAYVRSMSLPGTLAAEKDNTPSQSPVPVPDSVEHD